MPAGCDPEPVRWFGSFTAGLPRLAGGLAACGVHTVARESTGVSWIALFPVLEARGWAVPRGEARRARSWPGRQSDRLDGRWLQKRPAFGLLHRRFRPREEVWVLPTDLRQRENRAAAAGIAIQQMQTALTARNLQWTNVLRARSGATGLALLRGERGPARWAEWRDGRLLARGTAGCAGASLSPHFSSARIQG